MLSHYTSVFFKVLWKNKIPNLINILGLIVGMASAIIIAKYVGYSLTFEHFHQNQQNIFQLRQTETKNGNTEYVGGLTYRGIPIAAQQTIPEVINYTGFNSSVETLVMSANEEGEIISHNEQGIFGVDSSFLHMFTFEASQGNQESALSHPNSAVMTHAVAQKYFGDKNPIGQTITTRVSWGAEQNWTVSCVLEDPPKNSKIQFDILLFGPTDQDKLWEAPVYNQFIQTTTTSDPEEVSRKISSHISSLPIFKEQGREISVMLMPLTPSLTTFEIMLALIGIFILLLSWINFINLSIAQSLNRSGEVGIRKALGSSNRQLVEQFVLESLFMNLIALLMTILFLTLSYDYFQKLTGNHLLPLFDNSLHINTLFFICFIIGSILTSAYPSLHLVSKKLSGLPKAGKTTDQRGWALRRGLVVAQFAISSVMVMGTFVISSQMDYMMSKDLGFNPTHKLIIKPPKDLQEGKGKRMMAIKEAFASRSWIERITTSSTIPGESYRQEVYFSLQGSDKMPMLYINEVDSGFIRSFGIKFLAGKDFSTTGGAYTNKNKVIINEASAWALGLSPDDAIDKKLVDQEEGETYIIIGVVENYHKISLKENIEPSLLKYNARRGYITLNLSSVAAYSITDKILELKELWQSVYRDQPFEYFLLRDQYYGQYHAENFFRKVFRVFTFISICLACLGLIGLALFEASNRKLEVGIRKTFGASSQAILVLFLKKYLLLLLIATFIGAPISFYIMEAWLQEYNFRILLGIEHILIPSLLLFIIALSTIAAQIVKLSLINPAKILREE